MAKAKEPWLPHTGLLLALCALALLLLALEFSTAVMGLLSLLLAVCALAASLLSLLRRENTTAAMLALLILAGWCLLLPPVHTCPARALRTACTSNLKQIGYALHLYWADHGEAFPENLPVLFEKDYLKDRKVFICPTAREHVARFTPGETFTEEHMSYCYVSGVRADDEPWFIASFDVESNHEGDGVNLLFVGGNVQWRGDFDWLHDQLARQKREMEAQGRKMKIIRPGWSEPPPDGLSWR